MDIKGYRERINQFSFNNCQRGNQGFKRILIQLFGLIGHGKSSFINTCMYVWEDGEFKNWAKSLGIDGGHTTERIPYKLTKNITLVDNRGCRYLDSYETREIFAQLGNLLPLGKNVPFGKGFTLVDRILMAEKEIHFSDFIVPVFVHSVKKVIAPQEIHEMRVLINTAMQLTGVYPIVVLTHKTSGRLCETEATFRDMGVERIFSFENYTWENNIKTRGRHEEVLKFLHEVLEDVQFRVDRPRNPEREMKNRKDFVIRYVHEREIAVQRESVERQRAMQRALVAKKVAQERQALEEEAEMEQRERDEELRRRMEEIRIRAEGQPVYTPNYPGPKEKKKKKKLGFFRKK